MEPPAAAAASASATLAVRALLAHIRTRSAAADTAKKTAAKSLFDEVEGVMVVVTVHALPDNVPKHPTLMCVTRSTGRALERPTNGR